MATGVKICGLRTTEALDAAIAAGADYFGMVFFPRSPRHIDIETAKALVDHAKGRITPVVLLVDPDDDAVREVVAQVGPQFIQLHGKETPERTREIKALSGLQTIKAVSIENADDAKQARSYDGIADILLFDAKPSEDDAQALPGGNGVVFDWEALKGVKPSTNFMLSGGLSPNNVAEAIAITAPDMVDVSSGVESSPGVKDTTLIRDFVTAAKSAQK